MDWRHAGEILAAGNHSYDALLNLCLGQGQGRNGIFLQIAA
jgi:hypothetical protein